MDTKKKFNLSLGQLTIPIIAILILVVFNLIRDPSFFSIGITQNNDGNSVLSGNLITVINGASELETVFAFFHNYTSYMIHYF